MRTTRLFGLNIIADSSENLLFKLQQQMIASSKCSCQLIYTPNPEQVVLAQRSPDFRCVLAQADYLLPDGIGLVWASRLLRLFGKSEAAIKERITGVEVVSELLQVAKRHKLLVLIIGGRSYTEVADYDDLHWIEAFADKTKVTLSEEQAVAAKILQLRPDFIFVALGAPEQEFWLAEHRRLLDQAGVKLAMAVGGSFDFIFGKVARAPSALQHFGLEWLWRLCLQPWRWRRQLNLLRFISLLFRELI